MIENKYLNTITVLFVFLALLACVGIVYAAKNTETKAPDYESKLFGEEILAIDIKVDEEEWQEMLDNAMGKEYVKGDLVINGNTFSTVGIRTKGNSSLTQVASMADSDRYSLQFKADYYVKGQTFYGLDVLSVNNLISDATYMKDYMAYEIMDYIGVETPLKNYAKVTVNGEDFGFYLALERYSKSFLDRVYNTSGGQLYNVKMEIGLGGMAKPDGEPPEMPPNGNTMEGAPMDSNLPEVPSNSSLPEALSSGSTPNGNPPEVPPNENPPEAPPNGNLPEDAPQRTAEQSPQKELQGNLQEAPANNGEAPNTQDARGGDVERPEALPEGRMNPKGGGMGMGDNGGSLLYTDDEISSYSSIFNNSVFNSNSDKDKQRVITAIKNLNEGENLEKYFDVDEILRYLAAHTIVVNTDSYSSNMGQNYYIYENKGQITILPWDYNFAFGGFQSGDSNSVVNFPIDTPVSGVAMEDRPLISKLLEVDEYREKYHQYLNEIVEGYFLNGTFEKTILELDNKINSYVEKDSTSFSGYESYKASLPVFIELGQLRAESVKGQLDGNIPSTTEGQQADRSNLIDASTINLSDLGNMRGGGAGRQKGREQVESSQISSNVDLIEKLPNLPGNIAGIPQNEGEAVLSENISGNDMREMAPQFPNREDAFPENGRGMPASFGQEETIDRGYATSVALSLAVILGAIVYIFKAKKNY